MDEILFGIRRKVLEDKANRVFLKEYLPNSNLALSVITGIINRVVETHSCLPTYKPLDLTKIPSLGSAKWQVAITRLIKSENQNDVIWFDSPYRAILYIESSYPNDDVDEE